MSHWEHLFRVTSTDIGQDCDFARYGAAWASSWSHHDLGELNQTAQSLPVNDLEIGETIPTCCQVFNFYLFPELNTDSGSAMDEFRVESDKMIPYLRYLRYSSAGQRVQVGKNQLSPRNFHHLNESSALCVGVAARPETSPQQTNPSEFIQKHGYLPHLVLTHLTRRTHVIRICLASDPEDSYLPQRT